MGEKKRKRAAEEDSSVRPKKSRVEQPTSEERPAIPDITKTTKTAALSRQEKSERRSKKAKKAAEKSEKQSETNEGAKLPKSSALPTPPSEDTLMNGLNVVTLEDAAVIAKSSKKLKKERRVSKSSKIEDDAEVEVHTITTSKKGDRFICFVGNLPYNATSEQLKSHFVKIADGIKSIRLGTDKKTGKGKGYAFLEFDGFDKMKTCLKLYHHSIFDPSVVTEDKEAKPGQKETGKGRRINVELTAGGGGAGKERKEKIHAKNRKLDEERERLRLKEKEQSTQEGKKEKKTTTGANGVMPVKEGIKADRGSIHPSRLNRVTR